LRFIDVERILRPMQRRTGTSSIPRAGSPRSQKVEIWYHLRVRLLPIHVLIAFLLICGTGCCRAPDSGAADVESGQEAATESTSVVQTEPVEPPDPFEGLGEGDAELGRDYFYGENRGRCLRCHTLQGEGEPTGYALDDVGLRRDEEWLAIFLDNPRRQRPEVARMPPFRGDSGGARIADVVAFLMTLRTPVDHPEPTDVKPEGEPEAYVGGFGGGWSESGTF